MLVQIIQHHDQQQDCAPDKGDIVAADLREPVQARFQRAHEEDREQHAADLALAAVGADAAEHDDQDALQGIVRAVVRACGIVVCQHDHAAGRRVNARDQIGLDEDPVDVQAAEAGDILAAAEQGQLFAVGRPAQQEPEDDRTDGKDQKLHGDARNAVIDEIGVGHGEIADGAAAGQDNADTGEQLARAERGEDGWDLQLRDQNAVQKARDRADEKREREDRQDPDGAQLTSAVCDAAHEQGHGDGGHIGHTDRGEVDAAGDHADHDAERHEAEFRELRKHGLEVDDRIEFASLHDAHEHEPADHDDEQAPDMRVHFQSALCGQLFISHCAAPPLPAF